MEAGVRRDEGEPGARRLQELERENRRLKREVLADLFVRHGPPEYLRSDNGPEFSAKLVRRWLGRVGVETFFIEPGSP